MGEKNFLGIDWGERKIGLALAHDETRVAVAYGMLENNTELFSKLKEILEKEEIGMVIVGVPRYGEKEKHPARLLGEKIWEQFGVEVSFQDEMFTSKLAQGNLVLQGYRGVGQNDDAEAAKILLEGWLEQGK